MACFKAFPVISEIREYRYFRIIYGRVLSWRNRVLWPVCLADLALASGWFSNAPKLGASALRLGFGNTGILVFPYFCRPGPLTGRFSNPNPNPAMSGDMVYMVVFLLGVEQT